MACLMLVTWGLATQPYNFCFPKIDILEALNARYVQKHTKILFVWALQ